MNKESLLSELQDIFREHFKDDQLLLDSTTTQADVADWDSLNHAIIIEKIETTFSIKFDLMDMISIENIEDICEKILAKQNC